MARKLYFLLAAAILIALGLPPNRVALAANPGVTVVNPATNPAKTSSVDEPGRNPYWFFTTVVPCTSTSCVVTTPPVPKGKRLVIQHVSAIVLTPAKFILVVLGVGTHGSVSTFIPPGVNLGFGSTTQEFAFDQIVQGYVDAGNTALVSITTNISTTISLATTGGQVSITGYLIDCNANQCAPIVLAP